MRHLAIGSFAVLVAVAANAAPPYASPTPLAKPEIFGAGTFSTGHDDAHPTFAADGNTAYFVRSSPDFRYWTLLETSFANGRWSTPQVAPFSGQYNDADVFFTRDGEAMYVISNRPVNGRTHADTDIWMRRRDGDGWGEFSRVDALASDGDEYFPTLTDAGTIYFGSERPGGKGKCDLWRAQPQGDAFGAPENLAALNTPGNDIEAYVAPDESWLIFSSDGRPDTHGAYDLYVSFRCDGAWSEPRNLDVVNSAGWEFGARVAPDGKTLFFTSNRSTFGEPAGRRLDAAALDARLDAPGNGLRDIWRIDLDALKLASPCKRPGT
ncbi:MAG TPA: hypothetical protein VJ724_13360 [Tahibacter sp.]|nr:hypothetical protein [Tahibacter sp.]